MNFFFLKKEKAKSQKESYFVFNSPFSPSLYKSKKKKVESDTQFKNPQIISWTAAIRFFNPPLNSKKEKEKSILNRSERTSERWRTVCICVCLWGRKKTTKCNWEVAVGWLVAFCKATRRVLDVDCTAAESWSRSIAAVAAAAAWWAGVGFVSLVCRREAATYHSRSTFDFKVFAILLLLS